MNSKKPEFVYEITINKRKLKKGMEATLVRGIGHPAGRYVLRWVEPGKDGSGPLLFFYGPVRRVRQKLRQVSPSAVKTVHTKTRTVTDEDV